MLVIRERKGIDLGINNQAEQEVGATIFDRRIPVPGVNPGVNAGVGSADNSSAKV
ncbi:hypothetical protein D9M69_687910 [compost metagenome]